MKTSSLLKILAALLASLALVLLLAACGGGDDDPVTQTVTTGTGATPPTAPTTPTAPTVPTVPTAPTTGSLPTAPTTPTAPTEPTTSTSPSGSLEGRLPSETAVSGLESGTAMDLPTSQDLVDALYTANDPTKARAQSRFDGAGYAGGVLRDQRGSDPATGLALMRVYVVELGSEEAASTEVDASVDEIMGSTALQTENLEVPDIPTARALTAAMPKVLFVTFNVGPYLYGIQAFARDGEIPQDEVLAMASDLYQRG